MQLDQLPTTTRVTNEATGIEHEIAVGLLLMNEAEDDGRTTGWYWSTIPRKRTELQLRGKDQWTEAVERHQGPFEDGAAAIRGAAEWSPLRHTVAMLLQQAAGLVLSGQTAPDPTAIGNWIEGHEWVERALNGEETPAPMSADPEATGVADSNEELLVSLREGDLPERPAAPRRQSTAARRLPASPASPRHCR